MDLSTPLRRYQVFCLVVEEGGVTSAADALHVSQPAVSAQVKALEKGLGATLFHRVGHQLELTEAGALAYDWARRILAEQAQLQDDIDQLSSGHAGTLVVHASMAIGTYLLPPMLSQLRTSRSGAAITVHVSEPAAALEAARIGASDFAVCSLSAAGTTSGLQATPLWDEPVVLVAPASSGPEGDAIAATDLEGLPFVGVPEGIAYERNLRRQLDEAGVGQISPVIRLGHAEAIKQAVVDNDWVTLAPLYSVQNDVETGRLRVLHVEGARLREDIGLHHREGKRFSPLQRAAIEQLRQEARRRAPALTRR